MSEEQKKNDTPAEKGSAEKPHKAGKAGKETAPAEKAGKPAAKAKKKAKRRTVLEGKAYIQATFNNTLITITDMNGEVIAWSSAGSSGFKGAKKATPHAAQVSAENAVTKAKVFGLERVHVIIKGVGSGREQAIRGIHTAGINIETITDVTTVAHNGCRIKRQRRV